MFMIQSIRVCVYTHICVCLRVCTLACIFRKQQWKVNPKAPENTHLPGKEGHRRRQAWELMLSEHLYFLL